MKPLYEDQRGMVKSNGRGSKGQKHPKDEGFVLEGTNQVKKKRA